MPQETILFGGTIRENILYGRLDASAEEMIAAAQAANAHDFIMEFPSQYETMFQRRIDMRRIDISSEVSRLPP